MFRKDTNASTQTADLRENQERNLPSTQLEKGDKEEKQGTRNLTNQVEAAKSSKESETARIQLSALRKKKKSPEKKL